jgi:hypothetical protein
MNVQAVQPHIRGRTITTPLHECGVNLENALSGLPLLQRRPVAARGRLRAVCLHTHISNILLLLAATMHDMCVVPKCLYAKESVHCDLAASDHIRAVECTRPSPIMACLSMADLFHDALDRPQQIDKLVPSITTAPVLVWPESNGIKPSARNARLGSAALLSQSSTTAFRPQVQDLEAVCR